MIGTRVIEVDRSFDESQAQKASVEIDQRLSVAGDGGNVVQARGMHERTSFCRFASLLVKVITKEARRQPERPVGSCAVQPAVTSV
jgi:hypothetical protein